MIKNHSSSTKSFQLQKKVEGFCLITAPLLFAASSFFWQHNEYGVEAATLLVFSMFFWIPALMGLFSLLNVEMPRYSTYGLWVAVFGCVSGIGFAFVGYLATVLGISHQQYIASLSKYPFTSQLLLFASGPLFPLSLLILGINLLIKKSVKVPVALLISAGAVTFPLGRVLRSEWMAHISDMFILVACWTIAPKILKTAIPQTAYYT